MTSLPQPTSAADAAFEDPDTLRRTLGLTALQAQGALAAAQTIAAADPALGPRTQALLVLAARTLEVVEPPEAGLGTAAILADLFPQPSGRRALVDALIVVVCIEGEVSPARYRALEALAEALGVRSPWVAMLRDFECGNVWAIKAGLVRRSPDARRMFARIWREEGVMGVLRGVWFALGLLRDRALAGRFRALADLPPGSFGHAVTEHFALRGLTFPGEARGLPERMIHHDLMHVLNGYDTDAVGECEIAGFYCGFTRGEPFTFVMTALATFHLGLAVSPSVVTPARGAFDPERVLAAFLRGRRLAVDVMGEWNYWALMPLPLGEARVRLGLGAPTREPRRTSSLSAALLISLATVFAVGCSTDETEAVTMGACQPDRATYDGSVQPLLARYCGACHGEAPSFGGPFGLLDYDELLAGRAGARRVDEIVSELSEGSMPPAGMPRVPQADAATLLSWASCGETVAPADEGLVSSAPPLLAPTRAPEGLEELTLTARDHDVPPDTEDEYHCFVFDADLPSDRFVRRFEMVYGEARVLHHLILARDTGKTLPLGDYACDGGGGMPAGTQYLYAWAPGQSAVEFPSGGLRVRPGDRFVVTIHYNNGLQLEDVRDNSGVRLYLGPPEGTEYGMFSVGPLSFNLPPGEVTTVSSRCTLDAPLTLFGGMPHMHLFGSSFASDIERADGSASSLISLTGWEFESQLFYSYPVTLGAGDVIATRCTYDNDTDAVVRFGEGTRDEMCNHFLYATPPTSKPYCDDGSVGPAPTELAYTPSECLSESADDTPPLVTGAWRLVNALPELTVGEVAPGTWVLDAIEFGTTGGETPVGALDVAKSEVAARGQVHVGEGQLTLDLVLRVRVALDSGQNLDQDQTQTFRIPFDPAVGTLTGQPDCPADAAPVDFRWGVSGDRLELAFMRTDVPGMTLYPRYTFRRP